MTGSAGLEELSGKQWEYFARGATESISSRKEALRALISMMENEGDGLAAAISRDLGRCWLESWSAEPGLVLADARYALRHISSWNRPERHRLSPAMIPGNVRGCRRPYGRAVIIGPWNYPAGLLLCPMVSALAAGNTVILKPSERAPSTADFLQDILPSYFRPELAAVVRGGGEEGEWLIRNAADIVCFTGSIPTGRKVMADAASRPVPVVLELGGVNPCFVDSGANLRNAARRIAWGKFFGAGQTCLAPNHVYVAREVEVEFLSSMAEAVKDFYGDDPSRSEYYGRIIDRPAWDRLSSMLGEGAPVIGGIGYREDLYMAPTVLTGVGSDSRLLREEIFGPILPVIPCDSVEEAIEGSSEGSPLAVYGFSGNGRRIGSLLKENIRASSITVNGTLHRIVSSSIGFGGVGESGFGRYRGLEGFRHFSWEQVVLRKSARFEMPMLYPPYRIGRGLVRMLSRFF
ncbi:MAG: hypothetical protein AVO35_05480 [Candidatus Aegiribacteria sp. MLS_C]|nr:MAG: hypothetical protein AVO35_05480 [Candidatus Aegiribacteria sp. MLS_C]